MARFEHPGINMQAPWCDLLLSGEKTVETRGYPLPERLKHEWLWLIETPGRVGKFKARVRGRIKFSGSIEYKTRHEWLADHKRHRVEINDPQFSFRRGNPKFGWIVEDVESCSEPFAPPAARGIVYARPFVGGV
jgi:hypothetical protein